MAIPTRMTKSLNLIWTYFSTLRPKVRTTYRRKEYDSTHVADHYSDTVILILQLAWSSSSGVPITSLCFLTQQYLHPSARHDSYHHSEQTSQFVTDMYKCVTKKHYNLCMLVYTNGGV
jgi:hypothetical protein